MSQLSIHYIYFFFLSSAYFSIFAVTPFHYFFLHSPTYHLAAKWFEITIHAIL